MCAQGCKWGFPGVSVVKNLPASAGDTGPIPGSGRSPGGGRGNPLQCSCLEIPWTEELGRLQSMGSQTVGHNLVSEQQMGFPGSASGKEPACQCKRHRMWVQSLGREDPLEEGMATHSSVLAWRIPGTGEPGGLPSMGSHRVGHN